MSSVKNNKTEISSSPNKTNLPTGKTKEIQNKKKKTELPDPKKLDKREMAPPQCKLEKLTKTIQNRTTNKYWYSWLVHWELEKESLWPSQHWALNSQGNLLWTS